MTKFHEFPHMLASLGKPREEQRDRLLSGSPKLYENSEEQRDRFFFLGRQNSMKIMSFLKTEKITLILFLFIFLFCM